MFEDNELWQKYEKLKNQLRQAGCIGVANEIYKKQLLLEDQIVKSKICKNSKN